MASSSRSLKLSTDGKRQVDRVLTDKQWSTEDLAAAISVGRATATTFRAGKKGVDRNNFVEFCRKLGLDWETVAESESPPAPNSGGAEPVEKARSTTAETLRENVNEHQGIQLQGLGTRAIHWKACFPYKILSITSNSTIKLYGELISIFQSQSREKIWSHYIEIRLLSGDRISVDQLYVDVWLLNRSPRTFMRSPNKMLETFDLRNDRLGLGDRIKRNPGFDIANQESKLLILGKPGAGKTTFLKRLAIDWCKGSFQSDLVAVFIEFRQIRDEMWTLLDAIGKELEVQEEKYIKALLNEGKLLILMDGFDELSTQKLRKSVQEQLAEVTKKYSRNRYIMTCRTQIIQGVPDGFTAVEVADFNATQVQDFVGNWFRANGNNECVVEAEWRNFELAIDTNPSLKELTTTPVLLGLMCLVFQDEGGIPAQAGLLYERGIRLLLRKWNGDKAIDGWKMGTETYQKLDVGQKEKLLIEIAAGKFENPKNFVLFEQDDLLKQVTEYLQLPSCDEGRAVLQSIESQHGLLVERADELWSFSHLTFQEYFTTKWLLSLSSEDLSEKIGNKRWREVVQQLVKSQGQSDRLLRLIKQAIDYSISNDAKLQSTLVWVLEKAESLTSAHKFSVIRLFYFDIAFDIDRALAFDLDLDFDLAIALDLDRVYAHTLAFASDHDLAFDLARALDLACSHANERDLEFANKLFQLRAQLVTAFQVDDARKFWKENGQEWKKTLRQAMIKHRNIGHDWQLSNEQKQSLQCYYNSNVFLADLLKIENAVSPEARQEIEDNLLLPIAELKRRLPDQYGGIEES
jgi:predicted NACHT family NTPase/DNA-binding Xre family transcriptional regulator